MAKNKTFLLKNEHVFYIIFKTKENKKLAKGSNSHLLVQVSAVPVNVYLTDEKILYL